MKSQIRIQSGITLIEVMSSLAVLAVVIGGALSLYTSAQVRQTSTQYISDIASIRTAVRSLYANQGGYPYNASLLPQLIATKSIPSTMTVSSGAVTNSYGGSVTVQGWGSTFDIYLTNVPSEVCINMFSSATGWLAAGINGNPGVTGAAPFPMSPSAAVTACGTGTPGNLDFRGS